MSKTAREVIAEQIVGPSPGHSINDAEVDAIIAELAAAGFVIVPKEPTAAMIEAGHDTRNTIEAIEGYPEREEQIANFYRAMLAAATGEPPP